MSRAPETERQEFRSRQYASFEALVFASAAMINGDVTHLTWWAVVVLVVYNVIVALDLKSTRLAQRVWVAGLSLSLLVQVVVGLMSWMQCGLLRDALGEVGTWAYLIGNFVLHYWPTLRFLAAQPRPRSEAMLKFDVARIVAAYATLQAPAKVYGCGSIPAWFAMPAGVAAAIGAEMLVRWWLVPRLL